MMYNEENFLKDFAYRTQKNLEKNNELKAQGEEVYEVTQLINSFLGLLIFPQQLKLKSINNDLIDENVLTSLREGILSKYENEPSNERISFHSILRHLRNAIAHGRVKAIESLDTHEIIALKFTDKLGRQKFIIQLTIDFIIIFLEDFTSKIHAKSE